MIKSLFGLVFSLGSLVALPAHGDQGPQVLYVSPSGNNQSIGTPKAPLRSIQVALDRIQKAPHPHRIVLLEGVHWLDTPLKITAADSGKSGQPLTITAAKGTRPVISGGILLTSADWQSASGFPKGVMMLKLPKAASIPSDGTATLHVLAKAAKSPPRLHLARTPNFNPEESIFGGYSKDCLSPARISGWSDPTGGFVHSLHARGWGGNHWRITGKKNKQSLRYEGGWMNNHPSGMNQEFRFVENIKEELDAPGEWWLDASNSSENLLYFYPPKGMDLKTSKLVLSRLESLLDVRGSSADQRVQHLHINGIDFAHSTRTFMKTSEPLLRSDWKIYRGGALFFENVSDISLTHCDLFDLGGNAVIVSGHARQWSIQDAHITRIGGGGVNFVGKPEAVRSPFFRYGAYVPFDKLDLTPGPKTEDYPRKSRVQDCLIHDIGWVEKQVAGVQISMASHITVRDCTIHDLPRAGINVSEGTWGGHLIEGCDVFDTVKMTSDHGSFNSWGRDRFWHPGRGTLNKLVAAHPDLVDLDAVDTTIIRRSRWSCQHGWDIDLDDGSSNYLVEQNLTLTGGIKLREGFKRTVRGNICINNSLHPHVWFKNSQDVIEYNIFGTAYKPIRVPDWGKRVDYNYFINPEDLKFAQNKKLDLHSKAGDPMFVNPAKGDFRVKANSPALKVGFKNFPMRFGVRSERLKPLAATPLIPELLTSLADGDRPVEWLSGQVRSVKGPAMRSAAGLGKDRGVMVIKTGPNFPSMLKTGDVILQVGGTTVNTPEALAKAWKEYEKMPAEKKTITIFKNQKELNL